jgi:type IV pilus assembly protein PilE
VQSNLTHKGISGFTLVELIVVVAILAIVASIAIPVYSGYTKEAKLGVAKASADPLRMALEDYWLDNNTFAPIDGDKWDPSGDKTLESGSLGWSPSGDQDKIIYEVAASVNSYTITVTHVDLPDDPQEITRN